MMVRSPDLLWGRRGVVLKALTKGWERWEMKMKMLRGGCEKGWEMRDEDGGLWWGAVRKVERWRWGAVRTVERWEMKMGGGAVLRDEDWETWTRKVESEDGRGGCAERWRLRNMDEKGWEWRWGWGLCWEVKMVKHGWRLGFRKEMGKAEK